MMKQLGVSEKSKTKARLLPVKRMVSRLFALAKQQYPPVGQHTKALVHGWQRSYPGFSHCVTLLCLDISRPEGFRTAGQLEMRGDANSGSWGKNANGVGTGLRAMKVRTKFQLGYRSQQVYECPGRSRRSCLRST